MSKYIEPRAGAIATAAGHIWDGIKRLPATAAALTCTGVGVFYNAEFARQFGEAAVALAVASDVLKALAGPTLMAAVHSREWGRAGASGAVLATTLAVSLVAAFGSAQHRREATTDDRTAAIRAFDDADAKRKRLADELATLGNPRPVALIQAEVEAFKIDMAVWRRSNKCADISLDATKAACAPILTLYKERGAAARKVEIEADLEKLRPMLDKGKPEHADPQSAAISAISGLDEDTIRRGISLLIVLLIEVGAIGGAIMAAKPMPKRAPVPANDTTPETQVRKPKSGNTPPRGPRRKTGRPADQKVIDFVDRFRTNNGRAPTGSEIKAEFPDLPKSTAFDHAARARTIALVRAAA